MSAIVKGVFIVGAKRTPFGTYGGKFVKTSACDLQTVAAKAALAAANVKPDLIDTVNIGNVLSNSSADGAFLARHVLLKAGIPLDRPALQVNRLCGSGFQAVVNSCQDIQTGAAKISLAGGADNMSQSPYTVRNIRFGSPLGVSPVLEDSLWLGLTDSYCKLPMALTAEKLGEQCKITRDEVDQFSLLSQTNWKAAQDAGRFAAELCPVPLKFKGKMINMEMDEHARPQTTLEGLKKLPTLFKENGLVTAGSASGIADGAGALVLASEEAAKAHKLTPLARVVSYASVGCEPSIMGIGPVTAIQNALKAAGKTLNDMDLIEINEAFAAQALACAKELKIDMSKFNVNGGAIALGHPLAASGARITSHLVHELRRRNGKFAIGAACIGGGQGIAILIEAL